MTSLKLDHKVSLHINNTISNIIRQIIKQCISMNMNINNNIIIKKNTWNNHQPQSKRLLQLNQSLHIKCIRLICNIKQDAHPKRNQQPRKVLPKKVEKREVRKKEETMAPRKEVPVKSQVMRLLKVVTVVRRQQKTLVMTQDLMPMLMLLKPNPTVRLAKKDLEVKVTKERAIEKKSISLKQNNQSLKKYLRKIHS